MWWQMVKPNSERRHSWTIFKTYLTNLKLSSFALISMKKQSISQVTEYYDSYQQAELIRQVYFKKINKYQSVLQNALKNKHQWEEMLVR